MTKLPQNRSIPMLRRLGAALAATCLTMVALGASSAGAAPGDFAFAPVNSPGNVTAPAFPGTTAIWAGTCDLNSNSTSNGGVGTAPAAKAHCIDYGHTPAGGEAKSFTGKGVWADGEEPTWRLDPVLQAGAHPDATVALWMKKTPAGILGGETKNLTIKLPPGVVGDPQAVPQCPALRAASIPPDCPGETMIGLASLEIPVFGTHTFPIYNVEPRDGVTAEFVIGGVGGLFDIPITARGRTNGDYGIDTLNLLIPVWAPFFGTVVTLWGVPWAAEHDKFRTVADSAGAANFVGSNGTPTVPYNPGWGPIKPFFTNPTECTGQPLPVSAIADSWHEPVSLGGKAITGTVETDVISGCDKLDFNPGVSLHPTVAVSDSPTGLDVELTTPQNDEPPAGVALDPSNDTGAPAHWKTDAGLATAHLRDTKIDLPRGTSFNPAAADGLAGCTTAQVGLTSVKPTIFNNDEATCPSNAKIGTLKIFTPLLADPLEGEVFAAKQGDNPYPGSLTAIYLVARDDERGLSVKLSGKIDLDPVTGQISTTFVDNPRLPFDSFEIHFEDGPRAALATPPVCGVFENVADLIPWSFPDSGPQPTVHDPFPIAAAPHGGACPERPQDRAFAPGFQAGMSAVQAGANADFSLNVTRADGQQEVRQITLSMPKGLLADLSGIPYCSDAALAAIAAKSGTAETASPSCPAASLVGSTTAYAGPGSNPLATGGKLYLAGPYDPDGAGPAPRAPLSVAAVVPAIAGGTPADPTFDLGNVVVRSATYVDSESAQVRIVTDKLPLVVDGVPLRLRRVAVDLNRPGFMLNPTNCEPTSVGGQIGGAADPLDPADDSLATVSSRFQVGGCENLGFGPKLVTKLTGGTKRNDYPALTATLTARPGDANIGRVAVTLPHSEFLAQNHINTVCTRVQFAAAQCPSGSIYGYATAVTPLLDAPLSGPVYLRSNPEHELPDMVAALDGQVDVDLVGRIDSVNGGIRTTFDAAPDAPITSFTLAMKGGKKGLLVNSRDICVRSKLVKKKVGGELKKVRKSVAAPRAMVKYTAQNGSGLTQRPLLAAAGCAKKGEGGKSKRG